MTFHAGIEAVSAKLKRAYLRQPRFDNGDRPRLGDLRPQASGIHVQPIKKPGTVGAAPATTDKR